MREAGSPLVIVSDAATIAAALGPEIRATLTEWLPALIKQAVSKPWLTRQEVVELTGLSPRQLSYLRATRQVTFSQRGRTILYETESIYRLIEAGKVTARAPKS